jgi:hypothetical protein
MGRSGRTRLPHTAFAVPRTSRVYPVVSTLLDSWDMFCAVAGPTALRGRRLGLTWSGGPITLRPRGGTPCDDTPFPLLGTSVPWVSPIGVPRRPHGGARDVDFLRRINRLHDSMSAARSLHFRPDPTGSMNV